MSLIDKAADAILKKGEKKNAFPTVAIVTVVALLVIAFFYFRAWRYGKKLAKLLHERDVAEQEKEREKVIVVIDENSRQAEEKMKRVAELDKNLEDLESKIDELEKNRTMTNEKIADLKNWDDIDRYLASGK